MSSLLARLFMVAVFVPPASADEFDRLRLKWHDMLTGGGAVDYSLPQIRARLAAMESDARKNWKNLQKAPGRTALWADLADARNGYHMSRSWRRVREMALAWATPGQPLYGDAALLADIRTAMGWLEQNRYNARVEAYENWWHWEIGAPLEVDDLLVLLYDQLSAGEIRTYTAAVERFVPDPRVVLVTNGVSTAANRVWKCKAAALCAIAAKDPAKLQLASEALSPVLAYVTSGDGFYDDGSFIMHGRYPYTGGYGRSLLTDLAQITHLLGGSRWAVRDPRRDNLYRWVFEAFEPLVYRGAMMDMVRGREVSRSGSSDHAVGHSVAGAILRLSAFAPEDLARRMKAMVKEWCLTDTGHDLSSRESLGQIAAIRRLLDDRAVPPRGELLGSWIFGGMDRAVHLRPGWGFGIAMHSSRIANFESINNENLRGWHTADGMTYLYAADLEQFSDGFWPTVDPFRLPGTTVIAGSTVPNNRCGGSSIAGGATLDGWSAVMMELRPAGQELEARKSWFLLDGEVVALGSGIRATTPGKTVETVVENRRIAGVPKFTTSRDGKWAHLEGNLGYLFPNGAGWKWSRGDRLGSWSQINRDGSTETLTRRYHTIWFDHGAAPTGASYAYALLPGRTPADVAAYAAAPSFRIIENSAGIHAVADRSLGLRAVNFWANQPRSSAGVGCDKIASVLVIESAATLQIGVADPTQTNIVAHVDLDRPAAHVLEKDDNVRVDQLSPVLRLTVDLENARGRTRKAKFAVAQ